jgi:hypothetical protein
MNLVPPKVAEPVAVIVEVAAPPVVVEDKPEPPAEDPKAITKKRGR